MSERRETRRQTLANKDINSREEAKGCFGPESGEKSDPRGDYFIPQTNINNDKHMYTYMYKQTRTKKTTQEPKTYKDKQRHKLQRRGKRLLRAGI